MKNIFYSTLFSLVVMVSLLREKIAFAQEYTGPKLTSPTPAVGSLVEFITKILEIVIRIGVPVVAIAFLLSGYKFVTANGDPKNLQTAKSMFVWTLVGTAILFGSIIIVNIAENVVKLLGG